MRLVTRRELLRLGALGLVAGTMAGVGARGALAIPSMASALPYGLDTFPTNGNGTWTATLQNNVLDAINKLELADRSDLIDSYSAGISTSNPGATNDANMNAALANAAANGRGGVLLRRGDYPSVGTISVPANTQIKGSGRYGSRWMRTGGGSAPGFSMATGSMLSDMSLVASGTNATATASGNANNGILQRLESTGWQVNGLGPDGDNCSGWIIKECHVHHNEAEGIVSINFSDHGWVVENYCHDNKKNGIGVNGNGIVMAFNEVFNNGLLNAGSDCHGILANWQAQAGRTSDKNSAIGNKCHGNKKSGIFGGASGGGTGDSLILDGNHCYANGQAGLYLNGIKRWTALANDLSDNTLYGVLLENGADDGDLAHNDVNGNLSAAVAMAGSITDSLTATANRMRDNGKGFWLLTTPSNLKNIDNRMSGNTGGDIVGATGMGYGFRALP